MGRGNGSGRPLCQHSLREPSSPKPPHPSPANDLPLAPRLGRGLGLFRRIRPPDAPHACDPMEWSKNRYGNTCFARGNLGLPAHPGRLQTATQRFSYPRGTITQIPSTPASIQHTVSAHNIPAHHSHAIPPVLVRTHPRPRPTQRTRNQHMGLGNGTSNLAKLHPTPPPMTTTRTRLNGTPTSPFPKDHGNRSRVSAPSFPRITVTSLNLLRYEASRARNQTHLSDPRGRATR